MVEFVTAASTSDVTPGEPTCVEVNGTEIALFKVDDDYYAIGNTCTHQGGPLCEGELEDGNVECPWHGALFDIKTGKVQAPPAGQDVRSYEVRIVDGSIEVAV